MTESSRTSDTRRREASRRFHTRVGCWPNELASLPTVASPHLNPPSWSINALDKLCSLADKILVKVKVEIQHQSHTQTQTDSAHGQEKESQNQADLGQATIAAFVGTRLAQIATLRITSQTRHWASSLPDATPLLPKRSNITPKDIQELMTAIDNTDAALLYDQIRASATSIVDPEMQKAVTTLAAMRTSTSTNTNTSMSTSMTPITTTGRNMSASSTDTGTSTNTSTTSHNPRNTPSTFRAGHHRSSDAIITNADSNTTNNNRHRHRHLSSSSVASNISTNTSTNAHANTHTHTHARNSNKRPRTSLSPAHFGRLTSPSPSASDTAAVLHAAYTQRNRVILASSSVLPDTDTDAAVATLTSTSHAHLGRLHDALPLLKHTERALDHELQLAQSNLTTAQTEHDESQAALLSKEQELAAAQTEMANKRQAVHHGELMRQSLAQCSSSLIDSNSQTPEMTTSLDRMIAAHQDDIEALQAAITTRLCPAVDAAQAEVTGTAEAFERAEVAANSAAAQRQDAATALDVAEERHSMWQYYHHMLRLGPDNLRGLLGALPGLRNALDTSMRQMRHVGAGRPRRSSAVDAGDDGKEAD